MQLSVLESFYNSCPYEVKSSFMNKTFEPGEKIIEQGSPGQYVYILTSGNAKVYYVTQSGMSYVQYIYGAWELFGEVEALDNKPSVCNVEAISKCSTLQIENVKFAEWLKLDFSFTKHIMCQLSDKVYAVSETAPINIMYPLEYRFLILAWNNFSKGTDKGLCLTKEILAECMGTSIRSINRVIKALMDKDIIHYSKGVLCVKSQEKLLEEIKKYGFNNFSIRIDRK